MKHDDPTAARDALAYLATAPSRNKTRCVETGTLVAWHERTLGATESAQVKRHVAHCEICFETWSALCEARPAPLPTPSLWSRLTAMLTTRPAWQPLAAGALVLLLGVTLGQQLMRPDTGGLVAYDLSVQGGAQWRGGDDAQRITLQPGDRFELTLRPATAYEAVPTVRVYDAGTTPPVLLDVPPAMHAGQGTMRVLARMDDSLMLAPGAHSLIVVIGIDGALPTPVELQDALATRSELRTEQWQAWRVPVVVAPP